MMHNVEMIKTVALLTILLPFIGAAITMSAPKSLAKVLAPCFSGAAVIGAVTLALWYKDSGFAQVNLPVFSSHATLLFGLVFDGASSLVAMAVTVVGGLTCLYSSGYMSADNREHAEHAKPCYYAFLLCFIGAMVGLVLSSTILGQLLFLQIIGACAWGLIGYKQTASALKTALRALLITHLSSLGLVFAAVVLYLHTGSFELNALSQLPMDVKTAVFIGIVIAAWGNSAQVPLHAWLPNALEVPTPVSAFLDAAAMVKVGVYLFARAIISGGDIPQVIGVIGVIIAMVTLVYGFIMYLPQKDLKRLLIYSTITQLAYIFLACSLSIFGSRLALQSGVMYIFNHAFAKSLFFLVAGAASFSCGTRLLPNLKGIIKRQPLIAIGFGVAAMAITGVPPFNGFFSKFPLFVSGFELSREHSWLTPVMVIALIESVASFGWILYWFGNTVVGEPSEEVASSAPLPLAMKFTLIVLIVMSLCSSLIASSWLS